MVGLEITMEMKGIMLLFGQILTIVTNVKETIRMACFKTTKIYKGSYLMLFAKKNAQGLAAGIHHI